MTTQLTSSEHEMLYKGARREPHIVDVPPANFAMIDGRGDPNTSREYQDAISALYAVSYGLKFALKKQGLSFRVSPLECLWWADDMSVFTGDRKVEWNWTAMIAQPPDVSPELFDSVCGEAAAKKALPALAKVRFERFTEGESAQVLHVGPFDAERATIAELHRFIHDNGFSFDGRVQKHHEIYLSDIRRASPEKWKTVLRQPIVSAPPPTSSPAKP